ncbi:MAG: F0F1 ATP synthase subunit A [Myxococcota bacterium]
MGHHTWFDMILGTFYKNVENAAGVALGKPMVGLEGEGTWFQGSHLSIQHLFASTLVVLVLTTMAFSVNRKIRDTQGALIPEGRFSVRTFFELLTEAIYGQMSDMMGKKAAKFFLPLIATCAFMIFFSNVLGLIPGFLPPTDVLNTTLPYALVIFFTTHIFGVKENGLGYFAHFFGPIRKWYALPLMLLMFIIECISHIARPISLALRLAANMTGDHKVLALFLGLVPFVVPLPIYVLGCIVVTVQTLVFCLLSMVYISLAIAHEEH